MMEALNKVIDKTNVAATPEQYENQQTASRWNDSARASSSRQINSEPAENTNQLDSGGEPENLRDDLARASRRGDFETGKFLDNNEFINIVKERPVQFTAGVPLGALVPLNIKEKIWEHKFVEFSLLLDPVSEGDYTVGLSQTHGKPTINLTPKNKKVLFENQWNTAFDIFVTIYTKQYPKELEELLTYGHSVKQLMASGANWRLYDRQYRISREYSKCCWATMRVDLQLQARAGRLQEAQGPTKDTRFAKATNNIPKGYCFHYHRKGKFCTSRSCKFSHECWRCNKPHPTYACYTSQNEQPKKNKVQ